MSMDSPILPASVREEVIGPTSGWFDIPWMEIWTYRDLVWVMVRREFLARYKQSILGPIWFLFQPLATSLVFTGVFGVFGGLPTDQVPKPLFYMGGLVLWNYFSAAFISSSNVLFEHCHIFSKVYFPRLIMPISSMFSQLFQLVMNFMVFAALYAFYWWHGYRAGLSLQGLLLIPLLVFYTSALAMGSGLFLSALCAKYRDVKHLVSFGMQFLLFCTPIIYPFSSVPAARRLLVALNPLVWPIESFKAIWFGLPMPVAWIGWLGGAMTVGVLVVGVLAFNRVEKNFVDTV